MELNETLDGRAGPPERLPNPDVAHAAPEPPPHPGTSPGAAAVLSFVFPGLGQITAGAIRRGVFVAIPTLLLALGLGIAFSGGIRALLASLVQRQVLLGVVVLNGVFAVYHLIAVGDAYRVARRLRPSRAVGRRSTAVLAIALVATVGLHGLVGALGVQAYQTVSAIIVSPGSGYTIPLPGASPTAAPSGTAGATEAPTSTPGPAWAADGRLNLLLIGADAGPGRMLLRTDTMILLSVDVATGRAAFFGIPRNLINAPLPAESAKAEPDGRFPGLLNAIWVYAYEHPGLFPDGGCTPADSDACGSARGFRAITGTIQQLTGVPLDGAVIVNLNGFVDLVDAIGGLWIRTVHVYDTKYPLENGLGYVTINIAAGCHHLDGHLALAYARSRHQDSDYGRMGRQQQTLIALLRQVNPLALLPKVPQLLDIAKNNLTIAIPDSDIGSLAALAAQVKPDQIQQFSFDPNAGYPEYLTNREIGRIQTVVRNVFDTPAPSASAPPTVGPTATAAPAACGPG